MHVTVEALEQALARTPTASPSRPRRLVRPALVGVDAAVVALGATLGGVAVPLAVAAWTVALAHGGLYRSRVVASRRAELLRLVHAVAVGTFLLQWTEPRAALARTAALVLAALAVERTALRAAFRALRRRGRLLRPVAVVGTGPEATALAGMFRDQPELGYRVVAFVGDQPMADARFDGTPVVPTNPKVVEVLRSVGAGGVIVATTDVDLQTSNRLTRALTDGGIHVELSSSLHDIDADRLSVRPLGGVPVLYVAPVRRDGWPQVAKRAFDVVVAAVVLVASLPLLAAAAIAVKATSPGPVLYRQERVGHRGRRFFVYKLRSMHVDADARLVDLDAGAAGPVPKFERDPRVTPVGRWLRKLSVDELPQLLNVLRGEMSLVGPRPEQPAEVTLWTPELFDRLRVRPGLTGLWQVSGRSSARHMKDRWDLYYVDNWSLVHDLGILLRTVPVVLSQKGAH